MSKRVGRIIAETTRHEEEGQVEVGQREVGEQKLYELVEEFDV